MKQLISPLFGGLKFAEKSEFIILALSAALLPYSWQIAMWMMVLLTVNLFVKVAVNRKIGNPSLPRWTKTSLWLMVAFFLWNAITLLYSSDMNYGIDSVFRRVALILFPLIVLASDTSYFKPLHVKSLCYVFVYAIVVKFFYCLMASLIVHHKLVMSSSFDPLHHTYMAMYLMFALGFLYSEWCRRNEGMKRGWVWAVVAMAIVVLAYIVFVQSRTGMLGVAVMAVIVLLHQFFVVKDKKLALSMLVVVAVAGGVIFALLPKSSHRMTTTFEEFADGDRSDARYSIYGLSMKAIAKHPLFGVGIGDRNDALQESFGENDYDAGLSAQYNTHNIYLDAMLSGGVISILFLLGAIAVPFVWAWRKREITMISFLYAFAFSGLFEALLNRQMGVLFVGLMLIILVQGRKETAPMGD